MNAHEQSPRTEGYIATDLSGRQMQAPTIDWNQAHADRRVIGSLDIVHGSGWYMSDEPPIISPEPLNCELHTWPHQLFKIRILEGAEVIPWDDAGRVRASAVRAIEQCNPRQLLGPQRTALETMAEKVAQIRHDQQEAIRAYADESEINQMALRTVIAIAQAAGRYNTTGIFNFMWEHDNGNVWARLPIGNAAVALAHRDLLENHEDDLWNLYGRVLYEPWEKEMER